MSGPFHIACTSDGAYAPHTGAMLHSLLASNPGETFRIHVLSAQLSVTDETALRSVAEKFGVALDVIPIGPALGRDFPDRRFHRSCWYRVLLPELLPQLSRILYLDSDIIVADALRALWDTDVSRDLFAAVANPLYPFMPDFPRERLGIPGRDRYFNSGVLLLNLEQMRQDGCTERLRRYATAQPDNLYPEQDALSALFHDRCLPLHPRWNAQSTLWDLPASDLPFPPVVVREAREHPAVVHFIGPYKPWQYLCRHPLRHLYFTHRQATSWPVAPLEGRTLRNILLKPLPIAWHDRLHRMENALRHSWRSAGPAT